LIPRTVFLDNDSELFFCAKLQFPENCNNRVLDHFRGATKSRIDFKKAFLELGGSEIPDVPFQINWYFRDDVARNFQIFSRAAKKKERQEKKKIDLAEGRR